MSTEPDTTQTMGSLADEFRRLWGLAPRDPNAAPLPVPTVEDLIRDQRRENFRRFCPKEFQQKIDRTKIPNLAAWDEADKWNGRAPGIWLWSHSTGEAKSRMLWRKFGQLHVEQGRTVVRITGLNLAEDYHDHFNKNATAQFYRHLAGRKGQVVMLDDLDKMPLPAADLGYAERVHADRNARMLREVFDMFYEEHVPVLVTANEPIAFFAERCGPSTERRMKAVCTEVTL